MAETAKSPAAKALTEKGAAAKTDKNPAAKNQAAKNPAAPGFCRESVQLRESGAELAGV